MKKYLYIAASTLALPLAQGATLIQAWDDFSSLGTGNGLLSGATLSQDGSLHVNKNATNSSYTDRPTASISTAQPLTLSNGITVSFSIKGYDLTIDSVLVSLASDSTHFLAAVGAMNGGAQTNNQPRFYFNGSNANMTTVGTQTALKAYESDYNLYTFTAALSGGQYTYTLYLNGEQVGQAYISDNDGKTNTTSDATAIKALAEQEITRLTLGGWSGASDGGATAFDIDYLALHQGAMTAAEVKAFYNSRSIPEPATATLSLLALAGLAARRRRK